MSDDIIFNYIINNLDKELNWKVIINDHRLLYRIYKLCQVLYIWDFFVSKYYLLKSPRSRSKENFPVFSTRPS